MNSSDTTTRAITVEDVTAALSRVPYPGLTRDLVSFGMVDHVSVCGSLVKIRLALRVRDESLPAKLRSAITAEVEALGADEVNVEIVPPAAAPQPRASRGAPDPWSDQVKLAAVKHVIAVGAGKGGVGKSTIALNLALALAGDGLRTALLDADIYGPSLPLLTGMEHGAKQVRMSPEKFILPIMAHGVPMISFGYFLGDESPAIWRGPMVSKAVKQFARGVAWPALDILIVDLPPGTGDVPLSLAQSIVLSGAVIVTQPPRVAAVEAQKAGAMFRSLEVPVLGVVENMTGPFGRGAGRSIAAALQVPLLGEVPFDPHVVSEGDAGHPTVIARPSSATARAIHEIARNVATGLGWQHVSHAAS
ncbi:MAG TPA: P-loop NTPase [Gemmatimonadaceae bacterium]|jgi:ATP-binding protein involved in chromosome partitioning|nr:P-loop NTPase [Gemmatimonadaceae bacterium]